MKRLGGWIGRIAAGVIALLLVYGAGGMVGGAIPANAAWTPPGDGIVIMVESNGVHTDLVLPVVAGGVDWRDLLVPADLADPRYAALSHVAIGWGERTFYLETPRWQDVKPLTVLRAATGSDRTVVHVEHVRMPASNDDARRIVLRPEEYRRLAAFIRASFAPEPHWHQAGYGANDAFYAATGRYSAIATCNAWTGSALRAAGIRVGVWTPFPVTVLGWFAP